jgi:hypothetical protein
MRKFNIPLWTVVISSSLFVFGVYNSAGKAGKTGAPGENTCAQCHSQAPINSGSGNLTIDLSSMMSNEYSVDSTYQVSVTVAQQGVSLFGFSIVALDADGNSVGSFTAGTDNHLESATIAGVSRQYLTHNTGGGASTGSHAFNFQWTSPSEDLGPITFYATGNAANGDQDDTGDFIYSASSIVNPVQPNVINSTDKTLTSLVWNATAHRVSLPASEMANATWTILDMNGRVVKLQMYQSFIEFNELAAGFYLVKCQTHRTTTEIKVIR